MRDLSPCYALIEIGEGFRSHAYPDPASGGYPYTIGYGTTVVNGQPVHLGMVCTQAEALEWMKADIAKCGAQIESWLTKPCTDHQLAAFISLAYNIGIQGFHHSQVLVDFNKGAHAQVIANDFMHWIHAAGEVNQGLINRRHAEIKVFETLDAPIKSAS